MPAAIEIPPEITGPFSGLVILAIVAYVLGRVIQELWRDHQRSAQEDRDERDRLLVVVESVVPSLKSVAASLDKLTSDMAGRHRKDDAG